jgi:ketosteroid isomerase-like protein
LTLEVNVTSEDQVLEAFNKIRDALRAGDTDALTQLIAEDYQGFDLRGNPEDRQIILEVYRPGGAKLTTFEVEELATRVIGNVGFVTGRGTIGGEYGDDTFEHTVRFMDVFAKQGATWQLIASQNTELPTT